MSEKLRLQREQIKRFVGDDPDAIRVIEKLLKTSNDLVEEIQNIPEPHDTGWIVCSAWGNQHLGDTVGGNVNHGFGLNLGKLSWQIFVSPTGSWADAFVLNDLNIDYEGISYPRGYTVYQVDVDNLMFQTGVNGVRYINGSGAAVDVSNGWRYRIIVSPLAARNVSYTYTANTPPMMIVEDRKPSGTNSGTFTSGAWRTRDLNTVVLNEITGASLSSNQVTLPVGTYEIFGFAMAHYVNRNAVRLQNTTDGSAEISGAPAFTPANDSQPSELPLGRVTITSAKVFELQHQCQTTRANEGFGLPVGSSFTVDYEVYAQVVIKKIA